MTLAALATAAMTCVSCAQPADAPPAAPQPAASATPGDQADAYHALADAGQLERLADAGRFDELLQTLQQAPAAPVEDPALQSLIDNLERYRNNQQMLEDERLDAFEKSLVDVRKQVDAGDLEEAIIAAITAHSIADAPLLVLRNPAVVDLVTRTEIAAKQAELEEDWVEASVLFGRLNLLYEDDHRFEEDLKRVSSHLRVLAMYHPEDLRRLQRARAERVDRLEEFEKAQPDDEPWQTRLNGIDADMLRESIQTATQRHIDHEGYAKLLRGAIEPLMILIDTPSLAATFPGLADAEAVEDFRAAMLRIKADLGNADPQMPGRDAQSIVDQVLAHNQRTINLPEPVIAYEMTEGGLSTLDDFSSMYWPEDIDFLSRSTQGSFPGIGVQIARRNEQLTVISPLNGTPAQQAGLKAGDVIATVDGKDTSSWSLNKAVRNITGPPGSEVNLQVLRVGEPKLVPYTIIRSHIEIESVKGWDHSPEGDWDYWLDREAGIGYIRLTQFIPQSVDRIDEAVQRLREQGRLNSLILDLRHNPGGLLTSAINIVDRFLNDGNILYTVDGEGVRRNFWPAKARRTYPDFEVVVLINKGSASASEIVSGALQDRGRAFIIGDRSYGKGSVQDVYWFPAPPPRAKYGLKVTTQYYQLPNGRIIHRKPDSTVWGIDPDLVVDVTDQTVAWNLELRQEIDVLRDRSVEEIEVPLTKPWVKLAGHEPVDKDAENAEETVKVRLPVPKDVLDLGLDPQLEAAMLVLQARQVSEDAAVAER